MNISESLSASMEDYLKAIFYVVADKQAARAKDIAVRLKVGSSSVTGALHALTEKGLINYAPYDLVTLTPKGKRIAQDVVRRHDALCSFLVKVLAVDEAEASETACKMEHAISKNILDRIVRFVQFVDTCPRGGTKWIKGLGYFCEEGENRENCERCISLCVDELRETQTGGGKKDIMSTGLQELQPGTKGRVVGIAGVGEAKKRIVEMGVTPGTVVEVERVAPLGDPIEIRVKGYSLSLRKEEASRITVEPLEADRAG